MRFGLLSLESRNVKNAFHTCLAVPIPQCLLLRCANALSYMIELMLPSLRV